MNLREQFERETGIPAEAELFGKKWDFNDEYVEWLEKRNYSEQIRIKELEQVRDKILDRQFEMIGSDGIRRSAVNVESIQAVFDDLNVKRQKHPF